ncbi:MAG: alpha/beta hydrolase family protein [Planctomycetota bacterium]
MSDRLAAFTRSLRERSELGRLGPAPALFAHPDGERPAPLLLWLHGRTVSKELDSARYLRLIRAGICVLALDLPGHGERADPALQAPGAMRPLLTQALSELDGVLEALWASPWGPLVARERLAMGGMSAGGMITLRRLCEPHPFRCAAVESTCGDFAAVDEERFRAGIAAGLDPRSHLEGWRPLPLLALHSERDRVTPLRGITGFLDALRGRYAALGADPAQVELTTWPETGAPMEHAGFGRKAREARERFVEFLSTHLGE